MRVLYYVTTCNTPAANGRFVDAMEPPLKVDVIVAVPLVPLSLLPSFELIVTVVVHESLAVADEVGVCPSTVR